MNSLTTMNSGGGNVAVVTGKELRSLKKRLGGGWRLTKRGLERVYRFKDFRQALALTNKVGRLAEKMGHHPDIYLAWGKARFSIWTHQVNGLTIKDFILAAKIGKLARPISALRERRASGR